MILPAVAVLALKVTSVPLVCRDVISVIPALEAVTSVFAAVELAGFITANIETPPVNVFKKGEPVDPEAMFRKDEFVVAPLNPAPLKP